MEAVRHPEIRERLLALSEEGYRAFSAKLLPSYVQLLGVRLPALRRLARELAGSDWRSWLDTADSGCFEEILLQGMVIGYVQTDVEEILARTAAFIPLIDNWSVCDSFCSGLKIAGEHPERVWRFLQPYFSSEREFDVRFAVVMGLFYYIDDGGHWFPRLLDCLDAVCHPGYYARMAVAWAVSICFVRHPAETMMYLRRCRLESFTYSKALQKIMESRAVSPEDKEEIRRMRQRAGGTNGRQ